MPVNLKKHTFISPKFESVIFEAVRFMMASPVQLLPPSDPFPGALGSTHFTIAVVSSTTSTLLCRTKRTPIRQYTWERRCLPVVHGRAGRGGPNIRPLYRRLAEHAANINGVKNLKASDFCCRFMILGGTESDLISACEAQLIRQLTPLWNTVVDGFGNHTPGEGRFDQARSEWDVLHPGRAWAARCRGGVPCA